jgi:hypothetical protein
MADQFEFQKNVVDFVQFMQWPQSPTGQISSILWFQHMHQGICSQESIEAMVLLQLFSYLSKYHQKLSIFFLFFLPTWVYCQ